MSGGETTRKLVFFLMTIPILICFLRIPWLLISSYPITFPMASTSSSITTSPEANGSSYDVFLSFRGEDTRNSFTDHLYAALVRGGLRTFRDNDEIERGEELKPEIQRAIMESRASIVVLSENYATSTWCLEELWLILEQRRGCNHFVLPVFYHVEPMDIRKQHKSFDIKVKTSTRWTDVNVNRWKAALTEITYLKGMVLSGLETKFLADIVHTIHNKLDFKLVCLPPNLTGMGTHHEDINSWLKQSDAEFLAICGMPGSGKTTLAKYILDSNWRTFENISFVEDIGSRCKEPHDLLELQEKLLGDILGGKNRKIPSISHGMCKIEEALQTKRALIVLDDIVEQGQLVALLGTRKINAQSKIIITTRVLNTEEWFAPRYWRCRKYKMKLLNNDESLELLCLHAFRSKIPVEGFEELAVQAVHYCEGNPLALEVFGSSLFVSANLPKRNNILHWKSTLNLLEREIDSGIQRVLIRSYESLPHHSNKELFLHIACFFIGMDMDYVETILEHDYSALSGIKTLTNRCLLSVSPNKKLMMHRLLQEMGRMIVRQESPNDPTKRSRVWRNTESYDVLRKGKGSETMEGLALDMQMLKKEKYTFKITELMTDSLKKMDNLKLLQLKSVQLTGSYDNISEHLRWLCWIGFHLRTIPSDLFMGNLVALDMSYSLLEVFEPPMVLQSLQVLNLKDSHNLLEIHNICQLPNLETLILWNCHNLVHVCETIGHLNSLSLLNMTGCEKVWKNSWYTGHADPLKGLKASTSGGVVTEQSTFSLPHSLQQLYLNDCYLDCTDYFPLSFSIQLFLQYLNLGNSLFEYLPNYNHLRNLRVLDLTSCSRLRWILGLPSTLAELYVYYCKSLERITFESRRFTLQEFGYEGCVNLLEIEGLIKLVPVVKLDEADLGHLKWLKEHQNHEVCLGGDDELTKGRSLCVQMLYEFNIMSTSLPDIIDLNMTPDYISESTSLSFNVPLSPKDRRLKGLNITLKYKTSGQDWGWFANISTSNGVDLMYNPSVFGKPASGEVGIWLSYWPIGDTLDVGDKVNVSFIVMNGLEIHECGASLVYTDDDDEIVNEALQNNMEWVEILGGDLSRFKLSTGACYLCRRDFFELMEVGRLTPGWFRNLVGDTIDCTEIRGWRKTGRPQQSNQSFIELKSLKCILHGSESEHIYKIGEMSKSSHDKTAEFTSSILGETVTSATASEHSHLATKSGDVDMDMSKASVEETMEFTLSPLKEAVKSATRSESSDSASESVDMDMTEAYIVDDALEFTSSLHKETMKAATSSEAGDSPTKDLLDQLPIASSSSSTMASPWEKFSSFDVYLSYDDIFTDQDFKHQLHDGLVTAGIQISPYSLHFLSEHRYLQTSEARASIVVLSKNYASSVRCLDELLLILERRAKSNHFVLPVFYDVEPSHVREHRRNFALQWYQMSAMWKDKVYRWKAALTEVANLPGFNVSRNNETSIIKEIVSTIRHTLYPNAFSTPPHPTQDSRAEDAK